MLTKKIAYCFLLFTIHITAFSQDLVLNEVMYSNKQTIRDSYGETPDWIEIYNTSDESIQLQHYALQDGSGKKKTWKFPHSTIEPHQYLLVFASGKNIQLAKEIHTDFKLGSMKEALYLLKHSAIIDSIE
nr:lamin tail domain-containing protein [Bacteroidales bacterium]